MFAYRMTLEGNAHQKRHKRFHDAVRYFHNALFNNWQTLELNSSLILDCGRAEIIGICLSKDSLSATWDNDYARQYRKRLYGHLRRQPRIVFLGSYFGTATECACRRYTAAVLYTGISEFRSPLSCMTCFGIIPPYKIPRLDQETRASISNWEITYDSVESLWIGSGLGEHWANRQLCSLKSELTRNGMRAAKRVEKLLNIPIYYYLPRNLGKDIRKERNRRCPRCRSHWRLQKPLQERFDFRCDRCQLLSNISYDIRWKFVK